MPKSAIDAIATYQKAMAPTLARLAKFQDSYAPTLAYIARVQKSMAPTLAYYAKVQESMAYSLSIPVVLAQTGAICLEVVGVEAWAKERDTKKPRTAKKVQLYVEQMDGFGLNAFFLPDLLPVLEGTSMLVNTADRDAERTVDPTYGPLNRHGVLHGVDLDFGTRENALRAFAALGYYSGLPDLLGPVARGDGDQQVAG